MTILEETFSTLFNDLKACGLSSKPTPPMVLLIEFFVADADTRVQLWSRL